MILTGSEIREWQKRGIIHVDPWEEKHLNAASIDLRLGSKVAVYKRWQNTQEFIDVKWPEHFDVHTFDIPELGIILLPNTLYLMHTLERVCVKEGAVPVLDGKSSLGRLGVIVHMTAGYGDPGFDGQYTLEVSVMHPIRLYTGMRFCQMRFHQTTGSHVDYKDKGHYVGKDAFGPIPSKVYLQFKTGG